MSKNTLVFILLINVFTSPPVNSATFENVKVKVVPAGSAIPKDFTISSEDTLSDYLKEPVRSVEINKQKILTLTENSLANLQEVISITVTRCGVKEIKPGTFKNVPKLKKLTLTKNSLEEIKVGVFSGLNVEELDLSKNKISTINDGAFNHMKMTSLQISNNKISTWNSEWFIGTPLKVLDFSYNLIEELPSDTFKYYFDFKEEEHILEIAVANFHYNKIKKIYPNAFNGLDAVNNLGLSNNKISDIDVKIFSNVKFGMVDLRKNKLTCVSDEIYNIAQINRLRIDGNPLPCECIKVLKRKQKRIEKILINQHDLFTLERTCI